MSVKIRLSRAGKKHEPFHRVVVMDSRQKRNGEVIATIGTVDALKGNVVRFDLELYNSWISKGAQPTDSAKKIYKHAKKAHATVQPLKQEEPKAKAAKSNQTEVTPNVSTESADA